MVTAAPKSSQIPVHKLVGIHSFLNERPQDAQRFPDGGNAYEARRSSFALPTALAIFLTDGISRFLTL
jgi:hypothetical protein